MSVIGMGVPAKQTLLARFNVQWEMVVQQALEQQQVTVEILRRQIAMITFTVH